MTSEISALKRFAIEEASERPTKKSSVHNILNTSKRQRQEQDGKELKKMRSLPPILKRSLPATTQQRPQDAKRVRRFIIQPAPVKKIPPVLKDSTNVAPKQPPRQALAPATAQDAQAAARSAPRLATGKENQMQALSASLQRINL